MTTGYQVLLVIPAYRETERLPPYLQELTGVLSQAGFSTVILVVDDGSPVEEQQALKCLVLAGVVGACEVLPPLLLTRNQGKGAAIFAGWSKGIKADWLAFVDADGALPASEVLRLLRLAIGEVELSVLCGSRIGKLQRLVRRRWNRLLLGRLFAWFIRHLLHLEVNDSQCGFKLLPLAWFRLVEAQLHERGYCFDLELLLALRQRGFRMVEIPVDWQDQPGGKVRPLRDGVRMLFQAYRLRKRFK